MLSFSRRQILTALGSGIALPRIAFGADDTSFARPKFDTNLINCRETPQFTEGPFFVNTGLVRRDITEGLQGYSYDVHLKFVEANSCEPLPNLLVHIWLASPMGEYSAVTNSTVIRGGRDTRGETFLRGAQITNDNGVVSFHSVFPGWYPVTPPHFHYTAAINERYSFTSQFFFEDDFTDYVYTKFAPYDERGKATRRLGNSRRGYATAPTGDESGCASNLVIGVDLSNLRNSPREFG